METNRSERLLFLIARILYVHLWLKFLGNVESYKIKEIAEEIEIIGKELYGNQFKESPSSPTGF